MNSDGLRPLLYVIAPFSSATNRERGERWQAMKKALALGWAPVWAPGIYSSVLVDSQQGERDVAIDCAISLLRRSDAIIVLGDRITPGMKMELEWLDKDDSLSNELSNMTDGKFSKKARYTFESLAYAGEGDDVS